MLTISPSFRTLSLGNPVADDVVDRGAATLRVAAIAQGGGHAAGFKRHPLDDCVNLSGRNAGNHLGHQRVEDRGCEVAGAAHALEALRARGA